MAEHATVVNVSRYRPASGQRDALLHAMQRMADRAAQQDGCFGAQTCLSDREPDVLVAISRWRSSAALQAFRQLAESESEHEGLGTLLASEAEHENLASA